MEMGDGDDVGWDHGGEGGQQEDNERVDVTTLGQLSDNFEPTFGYSVSSLVVPKMEEGISGTSAGKNSKWHDKSW